MLNTILLAIAVSSSFLIGGILYLLTREEINPILEKYHNPKLTKMKQFGLIPVGLLGLIFSVSTKTENIIVFSLLIFLIGLVFGSFALNHKENKTVLKYAAESMGMFLAYFFVVFIVMNLPALL